MFNVIMEMSILNLSLRVCCYERLCVCITQQKQKIYTGNLFVPLLIALTLSYVLTSVNIKVIQVISFTNFTSICRWTRATA